jgi:hypothetical protein
LTLKRFIWFVIALAIGTTLGLLYGWVFSPAPANSADLVNLREDYKADYILMVAEVFEHEQNPSVAITRLESLGDGTAIQELQLGLLAAQRYNFVFSDLQLMGKLYQTLQVIPVHPGGLP